jgi:hypothetical protein
MTVLSVKRGDHVERSEHVYASGRDDEWERFANYLLEGGPSPLDVYEASIPTVLMEKAIASARSGAPVAIDLYAALGPRPSR